MESIELPTSPPPENFSTDVDPRLAIVLSQIRWIILGLSLAMSGSTVVVFLFNKRLWRQFNIFQFNIALVDFTANITMGVFIGLLVEYHDAIWFQATQGTLLLISLLNIFLVAGYRYTSIVIDPFASRNLITTTRCIVLALASWVVTISLCVVLATTLGGFSFVITWALLYGCCMICIAACYALIYRAIANVSCTEAITPARLTENKRVLKTFALVYATNQFASAGALVYLVKSVWIGLRGETQAILQFLSELFFMANGIMNAIIYWWRLEEFRRLLLRCQCCRRDIDPTWPTE